MANGRNLQQDNRVLRVIVFLMPLVSLFCALILYQQSCFIVETGAAASSLSIVKYNIV